MLYTRHMRYRRLRGAARRPKRKLRNDASRGRGAHAHLDLQCRAVVQALLTRGLQRLAAPELPGLCLMGRAWHHGAVIAVWPTVRGRVISRAYEARATPMARQEAHHLSEELSPGLKFWEQTNANLGANQTNTPEKDETWANPEIPLSR
jgi:hypothetical protein